MTKLTEDELELLERYKENKDYLWHEIFTPEELKRLSIIIKQHGKWVTA